MYKNGTMKPVEIVVIKRRRRRENLREGEFNIL
jgi:hypothetical protein